MSRTKKYPAHADVDKALISTTKKADPSDTQEATAAGIVEWLSWEKCYDDGWRGLIVDEAFAHPAKAARGLIRRIFDHMEAEGWLPPRSRVLDVFGGIGTTGIEAASRGHEFVGVELEERFHKLALENFQLHRRMWESAGDPLPVMLHGDSRKAAEIVERILSVANGDLLGQSSGQLGAMPIGEIDAAIGSPPFSGTAQPCASQTRTMKEGGYGAIKAPTKRDATMTGDTAGQLGGMREGDVDAVISSPPYAETPITGQGNFQSAKCPNAKPARDARADGYVDTVVSSPPYEGNSKADYLMSEDGKTRARDERRGFRQGQGCFRGSESAYGQTPGQLDIEQTETFWLAARQILEQVHWLVRPNGMTAWIVKDYVKAGKRVLFCDNWAGLCEATGFRVIQRARCWLVKETTHAGLFGDVTKRTERKSFFRRLHEKKPGAVRIDFEEVLFCKRT